MWCITTPNVICHRIDDKGADTFIDLVGDYEGVVVCDALKTHEAGAREIPGIKLAACWAHVFRKFEEAEPDHPEAGLAMKWIRELYDIDERAGNDLDRRAALRGSESTAVLETLKTWLCRPQKSLRFEVEAWHRSCFCFVLADRDREAAGVNSQRYQREAVVASRRGEVLLPWQLAE